MSAIRQHLTTTESDNSDKLIPEIRIFLTNNTKIIYKNNNQKPL